MNTLRNLIVGMLALLALAASGSALAWHGGPRWTVGLNFGFPVYDPYFYSPPVVYSAPPVVYAPAPVVVQTPPSQVFYQYFCPSSNAYYPAVPTCSQPWLKVVPDGTVH